MTYIQEPAYMVGRICCDSEGRLNENSILLEGSVEQSNGMRTKLDVSKLDGYKLFPGQVGVFTAPKACTRFAPAWSESSTTHHISVLLRMSILTHVLCLHLQPVVITTATTYLVHVLQIVVVHGANPAGACVVAQKVYTSLPKAMVQSGLDQLQQSAQATGMHASAELLAMFVLHCNTSSHPSNQCLSYTWQMHHVNAVWCHACH